MATEQRIYKVTGNGKTHLVKASTQSQALRHIAIETYQVEVCKSIEVADLLVAGAKLKVASKSDDQLDIFEGAK